MNKKKEITKAGNIDVIKEQQWAGVSERQTVYLKRDLLERARNQKINISEACRQGIEDRLNGKTKNLTVTKVRVLNENAISKYPMVLHVNYFADKRDDVAEFCVFRRSDADGVICKEFTGVAVIRNGKIAEFGYREIGYHHEKTPLNTSGMAELLNHIHNDILSKEEETCPKNYGFSDDVEIQDIITLILNEYEIVLSEN